MKIVCSSIQRQEILLKDLKEGLNWWIYLSIIYLIRMKTTPIMNNISEIPRSNVSEYQFWDWIYFFTMMQWKILSPWQHPTKSPPPT